MLTSIIAEEILAHRLGLIPLNVEPSLSVMKERKKFYCSVCYTRSAAILWKAKRIRLPTEIP